MPYLADMPPCEIHAAPYAISDEEGSSCWVWHAPPTGIRGWRRPPCRTRRFGAARCGASCCGDSGAFVEFWRTKLCCKIRATSTLCSFLSPPALPSCTLSVGRAVHCKLRRAFTVQILQAEVCHHQADGGGGLPYGEFAPPHHLPTPLPVRYLSLNI